MKVEILELEEKTGPSLGRVLGKLSRIISYFIEALYIRFIFFNISFIFVSYLFKICFIFVFILQELEQL